MRLFVPKLVCDTGALDNCKLRIQVDALSGSVPLDVLRGHQSSSWNEVFKCSIACCARAVTLALLLTCCAAPLLTPALFCTASSTRT